MNESGILGKGDNSKQRFQRNAIIVCQEEITNERDIHMACVFGFRETEDRKGQKKHRPQAAACGR